MMDDFYTITKKCWEQYEKNKDKEPEDIDIDAEIELQRERDYERIQRSIETDPSC
ncbi:hypothetical protein [Nitrososphaeria virus YSH_174770]|uniref:Uncharacterized protein n=1 Tax=Nitrososphaeria virus YSH_174770 TaxID=3071322 RepID=A0A976YF56_9CAUD|nr:hypothetical protein QKV93_gp34 [Yangshan Harbor Nitrososphaeria virus]UVF62379.1 hypothetical protein [Nitrososphaeria virus YSH_174770]